MCPTEESWCIHPAPLVALVGREDVSKEIQVHLKEKDGTRQAMEAILAPHCGLLPKVVSPRKSSQETGTNARSYSCMIKRCWIQKHMEKRPSVVVCLLEKKNIAGDPNSWNETCRTVDYVYRVVQPHGSKVVLALVEDPGDYVTLDEAQIYSLRKRIFIDSGAVVPFHTGELETSLRRLTKVIHEAAWAYYLDKVNQIKARLHSLGSNGYGVLHVRYWFKMGIFAEFVQDWDAALKALRASYDVLVSLESPLPGRETQFLQWSVERCVVAQHLLLKMSTILIHKQAEVEAVHQFRRHIQAFRIRQPNLPAAFVAWHQGWLSMQYQMFSSLLPLNNTNIQILHNPGWYLLMSARHLIKRRSSASEIHSTCTSPVAMDEEDNCLLREGVFLGQKMHQDGRQPTEKEWLRLAASEESSLDHSKMILEDLTRSQDLIKNACMPRIMQLSFFLSGREHVLLGEYDIAITQFSNILRSYRAWQWDATLVQTLQLLRECFQKIGNRGSYALCSLELCSLQEGLGPALCTAIFHSTDAIIRDFKAGEEVEVEIGQFTSLSTSICCLAGFVPISDGKGAACKQGLRCQVLFFSSFPGDLVVEGVEIDCLGNSCDCITLTTVRSEVLKPRVWTAIYFDEMQDLPALLECKKVTLHVTKFFRMMWDLEETQEWNKKLVSRGLFPKVSFSGILDTKIEVSPPRESCSLRIDCLKAGYCGELFQLAIDLEIYDFAVEDIEIHVGFVSDSDHPPRIFRFGSGDASQEERFQTQEIGTLGAGETRRLLFQCHSRIPGNFLIEATATHGHQNSICLARVTKHICFMEPMELSTRILSKHHEYLLLRGKGGGIPVNIDCLLVATLSMPENGSGLIIKKVELKGPVDKSMHVIQQYEMPGLDGSTFVCRGGKLSCPFVIQAKISSESLSLGSLMVSWARKESPMKCVETRLQLPVESTAEVVLHVCPEFPERTVVQDRFYVRCMVRNYTSLSQQLRFAVGDSDSFAFSGMKQECVYILPGGRVALTLGFVALVGGWQALPQLRLEAVGQQAKLTIREQLFVFPKAS